MPKAVHLGESQKPTSFFQSGFHKSITIRFYFPKKIKIGMAMLDNLFLSDSQKMGKKFITGFHGYGPSWFMTKDRKTLILEAKNQPIPCGSVPEEYSTQLLSAIRDYLKFRGMNLKTDAVKVSVNENRTGVDVNAKLDSAEFCKKVFHQMPHAFRHWFGVGNNRWLSCEEAPNHTTVIY